MDTDGNGTLDRNEFNEGLIDLGIELRAQELDDLIDYFDHGGNGAITWEDFVDFVDHDYDREKDEDDDDGDSRDMSSTLKRVAKMVQREEEENRRFSLKKELERIDRNEKEYVKDSVSTCQFYFLQKWDRQLTVLLAHFFSIGLCRFAAKHRHQQARCEGSCPYIRGA